MIKRILITLALAVMFFLFRVSALGHTPHPLLFPKDNFTLETVTVKTSSGEKKVTCRTYLHIPYVANPVDRDFQSLNVYVPVEVDGVAVDATHAPILLVIGVVPTIGGSATAPPTTTPLRPSSSTWPPAWRTGTGR